jgi:uncharacterized protein
MTKVVLDANVFVSAVLKTSSNPGRVVDLVRTGRIKLLVSADILAELKTTLAYPHLKKLHRKSPQWINAFILELMEKAEVTPGGLAVDTIKDDPSDNIYLACAVEGAADFIVSGDHHLTDLKTFQGIRIVNPATFVKEMTEKSQA